MAKRHHDMEKRHHDGYYSGHEDRRHQEMKDAGMIREDKNCVANLPQDVRYHEWPSSRHYLNDGKLDDTIYGVNRQESEDGEGMMKELGVHKW